MTPKTEEGVHRDQQDPSAELSPVLGNVLLGVGTIPSAGPGSLHLVIGSCGLAIAAVGQGIGDLRGE